MDCWAPGVLRIWRCPQRSCRFRQRQLRGHWRHVRGNRRGLHCFLSTENQAGGKISLHIHHRLVGPPWINNTTHGRADSHFFTFMPSTNPFYPFYGYNFVSPFFMLIFQVWSFCPAEKRVMPSEVSQTLPSSQSRSTAKSVFTTYQGMLINQLSWHFFSKENFKTKWFKTFTPWQMLCAHCIQNKQPDKQFSLSSS